MKKNYINEENDWDHNVGDAVEVPLVFVGRDKMMQA